MPLLRGLLAEPTGNDDHPFRPVILKQLTGRKKPPCAIELEAPREKETDDELRARLAAALQHYRAKHQAGPEMVSLPGVGAFQVERPKALSGHDLAGRTAVVTGAAGAIGYGICRGLLQHGAHVAITDLPGARLGQFAAEFQKRDPARVLAVPMDVTDSKSVAGGFAEISAAWGGVDIVVINAGIAMAGALKELNWRPFAGWSG